MASAITASRFSLGAGDSSAVVAGGRVVLSAPAGLHGRSIRVRDLKFHILHVIPNPTGHGLFGYREVIDSFIWGLQQLGHEVTYAVNRLDPEARTIVFGGQMLPAEDQHHLRPDSIFYNLEQMANADPHAMRSEIQGYAAKFQIWDYSEANLRTWFAMPARFPPRLVPISYAPVLERIPRAANQDIDVLMYGMPNDRRLAVFNGLCSTGLIAVFLCGIYGSARDELISRSKVIVNVTLYEESKIFEVVRVSYLMANRKAVVALLDPDTVIEKDLVGAFHGSTNRSLVRDVHRLIDDDAQRRELEDRGHDIIQRRNIVDALAKALA